MKILIWLSLLLNISAITIPLQSLVNQEALNLYSQGSYRHSIAVLTNQPVLSNLEYYLLARDYTELSDDGPALECFRKISREELKKEKSSRFFIENYCYYYSKLLLDKMLGSAADSVSNQSSVLENLINILPANSVYYGNVMNAFGYYLWKNHGLSKIFNFQNSNSVTLFYQALSHYEKGDHTLLQVILQAEENRTSRRIWGDLVSNISPQDLSALSNAQLLQVYALSQNAGLNDLAANSLDQYYGKTHDEDLKIRFSAKEWNKKGETLKALESLERWVESGKAGPLSTNLLASFLSRTSPQQALDFYRNACISNRGLLDDYLQLLLRLQKYEELSGWYTKNSADPSIRKNYGEWILRAFLQENPEKAKALLSADTNSQKDLYFQYISALFDLTENKEESAYRNFLQITLNFPYTYEWTVSSRYERRLRENYPGIFQESLHDFTGRIKDLPKPDKALAIKALEAIDTNIHKAAARDKDFQKSLKEAQMAGSNSPAFLSKVISAFLQKKDPETIGFNRENLSMSDLLFDGQQSRLKASYLFTQWYYSAGLLGAGLSRLNYYITQILGGRRYHFLLDDTRMRDLYPKDAVPLIMEQITNTNLAVCALSAFREESHFDMHAVSPAGAVGISQLMPVTAKQIIKNNFHNSEMSIFDFQDNLTIGSYHYQHLFKKYKYNILAALAAYNAGETIVNRWKRKFDFSNELWVERIDYSETREYIKKIMVTRYFYHYLYSYPIDE